MALALSFERDVDFLNDILLEEPRDGIVNELFWMWIYMIGCIDDYFIE